MSGNPKNFSIIILLVLCCFLQQNCGPPTTSLEDPPDLLYGFLAPTSTTELTQWEGTTIITDSIRHKTVLGKSSQIFDQIPSQLSTVSRFLDSSDDKSLVPLRRSVIPGEYEVLLPSRTRAVGNTRKVSIPAVQQSHSPEMQDNSMFNIQCLEGDAGIASPIVILIM